MNLEDRLHSAASELRRSAAGTAPPPFRPASDRIRPGMAFAAAFALVLAVFSIPYALTNLGTGPTDGSPVAGTDTTITVVDETTLPAPEGCVAAELYPPTTLAYTDDGSDPADTTEPVRDKLTRIAEAASRCDGSALAMLASPEITTTFGPDGGPEDIASWEADDERFEIITSLFNMTHGMTEMQDGSRLFVWPAAFAYDSWDDIPANLMEELLRIYSQEELDQLSQLGVYGGWRIGITEDGEWIFFVAGD